MRSWRDKELPTLSGTQFSQIVVPKPLRAKILKLAHDIPAAAHLGMIKTKKRLEQHFYWPSMSEDIKLYVRTCDRDWEKVANLLQFLCTIAQS